MKHVRKWQACWTVILGVALGGASAVYGQPSPAELADRVLEANEEYIQDIDVVTITSEVTDGLAEGTVTTTRFEKIEKDGRPMLHAVHEGEAGPMPLAGTHDGELAELVRHAETVERDRHDGRAAYVATVRDADFLKSLGELQDDMADDEFAPKEGRVWLNADDLTPMRAEFVQDGPAGGEMRVSVVMQDYQRHRGLPVAHVMRMEVTGMDAMMSEEDKQAARTQMEQLEQQLAQMPEEQRAMIEAQIAPQLEEFERLMASGTTTMEVRVTDVSFD